MKIIPSAIGKLFSGKTYTKEVAAAVQQIDPIESFLFGGPSISAPSILNNADARTRDQIYAKWAEMAACPIIHAAAKLQTTSALGGHETTGDIVFIEPLAGADKATSKLVEDISRHLSPILNRHVYALSYTGFNYGDAYARLYTEQGAGLVDMRTDEFVRPELVLPYEQGNTTVGFVLASLRDSAPIRLSPLEMARLKMQREQYVPQMGLLQKALRMSLTENDVTNLPPLPANVGGSCLYPAEKPYDDLMAALVGISGQRLIDSIDESIVTANFQDMTEPQRKAISKSLENMFATSKGYADLVLKTKRPWLTRIRHLIPVFNEKQVVQVGGQMGARASTISVEDAMLYAKLLGGALGTDISLLGFADLLSGGLGEGGFFRVSAQSAETARHQRTALTDFIHHVISVHMLAKYGGVFDASARPYQISFYGSIAALEREKQDKQASAMNTGMQLAQALDAAKNLGMDAKQLKMFMSRVLMVDDDIAEQFASIADQQPPDQGMGDMGGGDESV